MCFKRLRWFRGSSDENTEQKQKLNDAFVGGTQDSNSDVDDRLKEHDAQVDNEEVKGKFPIDDLYKRIREDYDWEGHQDALKTEYGSDFLELGLKSLKSKIVIAFKRCLNEYQELDLKTAFQIENLKNSGLDNVVGRWEKLREFYKTHVDEVKELEKELDKDLDKLDFPCFVTYKKGFKKGIECNSILKLNSTVL